MAAQEPKWLLKTSGQVTGPFSTKEVEEKITSRQTVAHDEITQPESPWLFVRDIQVFRKALDSTQFQNPRTPTMEHTATVTSTAFTQSVTDAVGENYDELTPNSLTPPKFIRDVIKTVTNTVSGAPTNNNVKAYGVLDNKQVKARAQEQSKFMRNFALFAVAFVIGFFAYNEIVKKPQVNQITTTNEMTLAMTAIRVGDEKLALEHFKRARESEPANVQARVFYNLFLLHSQPELGSQVLANLAEVSGPESKSREVKMIKALSNMYLGRYAEAKVELTTAGQTMTNNNSLKSDVQLNLNSSIVAFLEGALDKAKQKIADTPSANHLGLKNVLYAMIALKRANASADKSELKSASNSLDQFIRRQSNWRLEAAILKSYILHLLGESAEFERYSYHLIELDPDMTNLHWQDPWIAHELVSNEVYTQWCLKLVQVMPDSARRSMVESYCWLKQNRQQEAQRAADLALAKAPKDALINAWFAVVYRDSGFEGKAGEHFAKADQYNEGLNEKEKLVLPWALQGRWLEEGRDFQAASVLWNKVVSRDTESLSAITGRARYMFETGNINEANEFAKKATSLSSDYKPLLKLTYDIEGKQKL
jgi:tetratricopeptide (TPR) repeat protein